MFRLELDQRSWEVINRLSESLGLWEEHMHNELSEELAKKAEEHFKPMLSVRPEHTGNLERSIRHEIRQTGDGWEVEYYGLFYGLYIDVGNFDPSTALFAADYDHRAFPVDKRLGAPYFTPIIHGMGSATPGVPTHYSEKTVDWLAGGAALEVAYEKVMEFLSEVIR